MRILFVTISVLTIYEQFVGTIKLLFNCNMQHTSTTISYRSILRNYSSNLWMCMHPHLS